MACRKDDMACAIFILHPSLWMSWISKIRVGIQQSPSPFVLKTSNFSNQDGLRKKSYKNHEEEIHPFSPRSMADGFVYKRHFEMFLIHFKRVSKHTLLKSGNSLEYNYFKGFYSLYKIKSLFNVLEILEYRTIGRVTTKHCTYFK